MVDVEDGARQTALSALEVKAHFHSVDFLLIPARIYCHSPGAPQSCTEGQIEMLNPTFAYVDVNFPLSLEYSTNVSVRYLSVLSLLMGIGI